MIEMKINEVNAKLTEEELREIDAASKLTPVFDEDCPEMTPEMLSQFKRMRSLERNKQTVSLRLSPSTLKKARQYGKGYTSFLSRLLDAAINDEELIRRCI